MISVILVLLLSFVIQDRPTTLPPEYGEIAELKKLQRVYIYTDDREGYYRIAKEINKYKDLQEVDKISDAEFVLIYFGSRATLNNYSNAEADPNIGYGTFDPSSEREVGIMKAVVPGARPGSLRILWQSEKGRRLGFGKDPEVKCAQEFIKELKKVKQEK
jgi:hypothetical protein